jgi:hypothetical protein
LLAARFGSWSQFQKGIYLFHGLSNRVAISIASLACVVSLFLTGCATPQPVGSEQWKESQRAVLTERAEGRWNALIKGDIDKVYTYTSPEYRSVVSLQQYKGKYGHVITWRMAKVGNVSYDDSTVATVSVEVTYRVDVPGTGGEAIETQKAVSEKWIYKDREWWYTSN